MPEPDRTFVYVVGEGQGTSQVEAEKAALADALGKFASQVAITVTAKTIDVMSTRDSETVSFSETRSSARARVRDAEPVGRPWVAVTRRGRWPFRAKATYTVSLLVRWPHASLRRERLRQASASKTYADAVARLAREVVSAIAKSGSSATTFAVVNFREATTQRLYPFTRVLHGDLADGLVRAGLGAVHPEKAKVLITGVYRVLNGEIVVSARIVRPDTGERIGAADVAFDRDAIEPAWLENNTPIEPYFESVQAEKANTALRAGAISVTSTPEGAQIFIDGEAHGKSPAAFGRVQIGDRAVMVVADGFEPFIQKVRVLEGETVPVEAVLLPLVGDLELRSRPTGAEVVRNGRSLGKTPLKLMGLPVGTYQARLVLSDHEDAAVSVEVKHKATAVEYVSLIEQPGSLFVMSRPPGAEVFVDGVRVGRATAPKFLAVDHVAAGEHKVSAELRGVGVWSGAVTVHANKTEQVVAELKNNMGSLSLSITPPDAMVAIDFATMKHMPLPGLDPRADLCARQVVRNSSQDSALETCEAILDFPEGEHTVDVSAPGHQSARRTVAIRAGKRVSLRVKLLEGDERITNGVGGEVFHELLPWTKEYGDICRAGDSHPGVKVVTCVIGFPLVTVISLGIFPIVGDAVALPFRLVGAVGRRISKRDRRR